MNGTFSDLFTINAGVPQGSMLSSTLFLIYINDLLEITDSPVYSFADDSKLVSAFTSDRPISSAGTRTRIQHQVSTVNEDLERILDWGGRNLMQFNAQKTQATLFSKKVNSAGPIISMTGSPVR